MTMSAKRSPAILVPVKLGAPPPFGYVRDFYTELAASPWVAALYDFCADFVETDVSGGILSVRDSLGKSATPLTLVPGAMPARFTDIGGGGADFSVSTDVRACVYQGPEIASSTGVGIAAVFTPTNFTIQQVIASFGAGSSNFWYDGSVNTVKNSNISPAIITAFGDGKPEWALGMRTPTANTIKNEKSDKSVAGTIPPLTNLYIGGNNAALAFNSRYQSLLHSVLVLTGVPDADGEQLITDWAKSITPQR